MHIKCNRCQRPNVLVTSYFRCSFEQKYGVHVRVIVDGDCTLSRTHCTYSQPDEQIHEKRSENKNKVEHVARRSAIAELYGIRTRRINDSDVNGAQKTMCQLAIHISVHWRTVVYVLHNEYGQIIDF